MADAGLDREILRQCAYPQAFVLEEGTLQSGVAELGSSKHHQSIGTGQTILSPWTVSRRKRIFDIAVVLLLSPILLLLLFAIASSVLALSGMPVLFRQIRIGCDGRRFNIYKFRTMRHTQSVPQDPAVLRAADEITSLGRTLRRFKLDELPQMLNVLKGEMSLVGPRPKIPEQQYQYIACRPGLTGTATLAFAREELLLAQIPSELLQHFYLTRILPAKHQIDSEYLQHATFLSDLVILFCTVRECLQAFATPVPLCPNEVSVTQSLPDVFSEQTSE